MSQNGGRRLGLVHDTKRKIGLGKPRKRLFNLVRRLEIRHDNTEPVNRCRIIPLLEIIAAHRHFATGQLILQHIDLELRVRRIFGCRPTLDDFGKRNKCLLRTLLITRHVGNSVVISIRDHVSRIGCVWRGRIERKITLT